MGWFDEHGDLLGGNTGVTGGSSMEHMPQVYSGEPPPVDMNGQKPTETQLPTGYSQSEVNDWLSRNQGDSGRMMEALNDRTPQAIAAKYAQSMETSAPAIQAPQYRSLSDLGLQGPSFQYRPFTEQYQAPTAESLQSMPGYQARQDAAQKAVQRSAAARGTLLTPGTVQAQQQVSADIASQAYESENTRQMNEYLNRYNIDNSNQMNTFNTGQQGRMNDFSIKSFYDNLAEQQRNNTFNMGRTNRMDTFGMGVTNQQLGQTDRMNDFNIWNTMDSNYYNRLFGLAGIGQNASNQQQQANQFYNQSGQDLITGSGNAQAAGTAGSSNAWNSAFGGIGTDLTMAGLLRTPSQPQSRTGGFTVPGGGQTDWTFGSYGGAQ